MSPRLSISVPSRSKAIAVGGSIDVDRRAWPCRAEDRPGEKGRRCKFEKARGRSRCVVAMRARAEVVSGAERRPAGGERRAGSCASRSAVPPPWWSAEVSLVLAGHADLVEAGPQGGVQGFHDPGFGAALLPEVVPLLR